MKPSRWKLLAAAALGLALAFGVPMPSILAETPAASAPKPGGSTATFLIVNPSGRGNQALAQGFLADFAAALASSWPKGAPPTAFTGRYHVHESDALASLERDAPAFALVSTGFYLAHRESLRLVPLLVPELAHEGPGVVHVVVKADAPQRDVATMRLGGQLAGEPAFTSSCVLALAPGSKPAFVPLARTLEAVRRLERGELDGVLVTDADWARLRATGKAKGLRTAFTSAPLPEGPVVAFGEPGPLARAAATAMRGFATTDAGRKALARMEVKGFREAKESDYAPLFPAYDRATEPPGVPFSK